MFNRIPIAAALAVLVAVVLTSTAPGQPGTPSGPPSGDPPGWDKALQAKQRHAQRLLDLPGIAGIGVGVNKAGKPVIEIYKENDNVKGVPKQLDDVPVEATTTGVLMARAPTDEFPRPVPIGVSSGHLNTATGTLGARVVDGSGTVYALSNNHVFAAVNGASIGDGIIQPGNVDGGTDPEDRIGTLHDFQQINFSGGNNTMDAAIALTTTGMVGVATPPDGYGAPSTVTAQAFVGQGVQKYGRTTGFQVGTVNSTNATVDVCYAFLFVCFQQARFVNQITISPGGFSAAGDSGSLIVTQGGNQPVALLFAGGDGLTIGNPIDVVLQRFGVTIDGSVPPPGPPSPPPGLTAVAGDASVSLSWTAPYNGGSQITNYKIYRRTSTDPEALVGSAGTSTTYPDTGLTNGVTYFYRVAAENEGHGEGQKSSEASATPTDVVLPAEPLPVVDNFNRSENPLSDGGRWTNGVIGPSESGLFIPSVALACNKSSTCTAWRNTGQFGPDTEVWARVSTLPGVNNQIRLKARLQQVGTNGYDGYMLRTNQLSGTDQVLIDRIDNGAIVNRLTVSRELAAGDTMLLRVVGSTLEAWQQSGATWTRLGTISDSTYSAAGFVGIGLRGTSGRVDDFGARNFAPPPPPPPPTAPTAPTNLQAQPGNATVSLTWTAPSSSGGAPLAGYKIYRGENGAAKSLLTSVGIGLTSFQDLALTNGTLYAYEVSAFNEATLESPRSNEASATPVAAAPDPPGAPTNLAAQPGNGTVSLSWTAPSSTGGVPLAGYRIYRGENGGAKSFLAASATASFEDSGLTNGTLYAYEVSAVNEATLEGPRSNEASATPAPPPPTAPGAPTNLAAQPGNATVSLTWTAPASNGGVPLTGYRIYRGENGGAKSLLTTVGTAPTSFQDSGLTNGTLYAYEVSAVNEATLEGPRSNEASATPAPPPPTAPGAPTNLQAAPGDATVSLTWTAPSSDGGAPLTGYKIYRGENGGAKSLLTTVGTAPTSFQDGSLTNGTLYAYAVTAVNQATLESPQSNEASATPAASAAPVEPLPVVDNFNRSENPLSDGGRWSNGVTGGGESGLYIPTVALACNKSGTCTAWRNTGQYGPDTEVWARVSTLPGNGNQVRLKARLRQVGTSGHDGYMLRTNQLSGTDQVLIDRIDNGAIVNRLTVSRELAAGDTMLLRVVGSTLEAWHRSGSTWTRLGTVADSTYPAAGFAGIGLRGTSGRLDDFGVRNLGAPPPTAPGAPTNLQAAPGDATVSLTWTAPSSDGGAPLTGYKIYRGENGGAKSLLTTVGTAPTSFQDGSLTNGTLYAYAVTAVNQATLESPQSNEASATPAASAAPVEPLPVVDNFNRSENPLSDGGRWSNGVTGGGESGLYIPTVALACNKSGTCTAWRNTGQYGPDTEVWARVSTLPGNGNFIRLYARIQSPGSGAADGYVLVFTQSNGTDQVALYRLTNGTLVTLASANHEVAAGSVLLVRAKGTSLEGWVHAGSTWTRVVQTTDATYSGAGYAGVGIRRTTGRLDEFGAR